MKRLSNDECRDRLCLCIVQRQGGLYLRFVFACAQLSKIEHIGGARIYGFGTPHERRPGSVSSFCLTPFIAVKRPLPARGTRCKAEQFDSIPILVSCADQSHHEDISLTKISPHRPSWLPYDINVAQHIQCRASNEFVPDQALTVGLWAKYSSC
jgi:hypothetical protein